MLIKPLDSARSIYELGEGKKLLRNGIPRHYEHEANG